MVNLADYDRTVLDETAATAADGTFVFENLSAMNSVDISATNGDALASPVRNIALIADGQRHH
jgi:hypothetical protein